MNRDTQPRYLGMILLIVSLLAIVRHGHGAERPASLEEAAMTTQFAWHGQFKPFPLIAFTSSSEQELTPALPPLSQPENHGLADHQYFEQIATEPIPPGQPKPTEPQWSAEPHIDKYDEYEIVVAPDEWFPAEGYPSFFGPRIRNSMGFIAKHGIVAGVQGTFLAPIDDGLQAVTMTDLRTEQSYREESHPGFGGGVRTWLGLQSGKTGFLATYWGFETSGYAAEPMFIGKGRHGFTRNYWLRANTLDLAFFQQFCLSTCTIQASLGVRYAELQRVSTVMGSGEVGEVSLMGHARGASSLEGWGVTAALAGNIPMKRWFHADSCCPSPWSFFWRIQGAVLNADTKVQAITQVHAIPPLKTFGTAYSYDEAAVVWSGNVGMGSLQLGLNYAHPLAMLVCPAFLNFHAGFEGQIWQTGRGMAVSESNAFLAGHLNHASFGGEVEAYSKVNPGNVGLVGFFIGFGLSY
jgi:hypothetical protein